MGPLIRVSNVSKSFGGQPAVLDHVSFVVQPGEIVALVGGSGSGKTTMMNILGLLDVPDQGQYLLAGQDVTALSQRQRSSVRREALGFVFQSFNLLARLNLLDNVALALKYRGYRADQCISQARQALERVGLKSKAGAYPHQISGGQQQRVSIARAIACCPGLVLADEPTGNLDPATSADIFRLFTTLRAEIGMTFFIVTHDPLLASKCDRTIELINGQVV
ncbi:ABC transporter ATP-binding protein [Pseudomonas turukhanskensis]|uniref:ABC transporter ATP-binding protein n=1 Tax=Pseudomonas turukhanskensis TaxID=1806536 RepID=A0A9W6KB35_9PSED|nr:ABC transporter ATP-binding protein [Pseudomonas turukhanskensis]GLK91443.1 ABC transporter ATP-binding protein [Pseudomonas turukhanskensis]